MTDDRRSNCPIACTLDLLGDRWTLLVVRDLLFGGKVRFDDFLASPEGISTNILTERLKRLEAAGLISKELYSSHSGRNAYLLTDKGEGLRPVMKAFIAWGLANIPGTTTDLARVPLISKR